MPDSFFHVRIGGDSGGFGAAANRAVGEINKIRQAVRSLPASFASYIGGSLASLFGAQYLAGKVKETLEWADSLDDLAERIGINVEQLQAFEKAAKKVGASMESIVVASKTLRRAQADALRKDGPDRKSFGVMGITMDDLKAKSWPQLFLQIAEKVRTAGNDTQVFDRAIQLLGRQGDALFPAFTEGFARIAEESQRAGTVISSSMVKEMANLNKEIERAGSTLGRWFRTALGGSSWFFNRSIAGLREFVSNQFGIYKLVGNAITGKTTFGEAWEAYKSSWKESRERIKAQFGEQKDRQPGSGAPNAVIPDGLKKSHGAQGGQASVDALTRIGLFRGGFADPMVKAQRDAVTQLARLNSGIKAVEVAVRDVLS